MGATAYGYRSGDGFIGDNELMLNNSNSQTSYFVWGNTDKSIQVKKLAIGYSIRTTNSELLSINGDMSLVGAFKDSNGETGTVNQLLSSTGTTTDWVDFVNLYKSDGTLLSNRTISMGTNNLTIQGIDGSNVNSTSFSNNVNTFAITDGTNTSNLTQRADEIKVELAPLKIINDALEQLILTDSETNSTIKNGGIGLMHYTNSEEPFSLFYAQSGSTFNNVRIGGGSSDGNAATSIRFYTATDNTTTIGTNRMEINSSGEIIIYSDLVIDDANDIRIITGSGTPESAVIAGVGSTFHRIDGGASTSFYVKESGTGNTGWIAK